MKTLREFALQEGVSIERLRQLCVAGRVPGAQQLASGQWIVDDHTRLPVRSPGRPKKGESVALYPLPKAARQQKTIAQKRFLASGERLSPFEGLDIKMIGGFK